MVQGFNSIIFLMAIIIFIFMPVALAENANIIELSETNYTIGEIVHCGNIALAILGWDLIDQSDFSPARDNKTISIDVVFIGKGPDTEYPIYYLDLIDDSGGSYEVDIDATSNENKDIHFHGEVFPGEITRGKLAFQVSEQSKEYVLAIKEYPHSSNADVFVVLGQHPIATDPPVELMRSQKIYKMGEIIESQDESLVVLGWRISSGSEGYRPDIGRKLLVLDVLHINSGKKALTFNPATQLFVQDETLHQYERDPRFSITPDGITSFIDTFSGEKARVSIVYDVPEDSGTFFLNYIPNESISEKIIVGLGSNQTAFEIPDLSRFNQSGRGLGELINSGNETLSVLGWKYASQIESYPCKDCNDDRFINYPEKGNRFIIVDLLIQNHDNASRYFGGVTLRDNQSQIYQMDWRGTPIMRGSTLGPLKKVLYPYMISRGNVVFQVPEKSGGYSLALDTGVSDRDRVFVDLGPVPANLGMPDDFQVQYPNAHKIGEIIVQKNLTFSVLGWGPTIGGEPNAGMKYVYVDIMVTKSINSNDNGLYSSSVEPELQDNQGFIYENVEGFDYILADQPYYIVGLDPGGSVRDKILFEVYNNSSYYYLIFNPEWLFADGSGGDPIVVSIGSEPVSLDPMSAEIKLTGGL